MYKVDKAQLNGTGSFVIEFSECIGESEVRLLSNVKQESSKGINF